MIKLTRLTKNLEKLTKRIQDIEKATVESGYFPEQGLHPTANMSYASLMQLHEDGFSSTKGVPVPSRPIRQITTELLHTESRVWGKDVMNYLAGRVALPEALANIGRATTNIAFNTFGSVPPLTANSPVYMSIQNKDNNTPLILDGYLQANWAWKTSEHPTLHDAFE